MSYTLLLASWLTAWMAPGAPLPVTWSHAFSDRIEWVRVLTHDPVRPAAAGYIALQAGENVEIITGRDGRRVRSFALGRGAHCAPPSAADPSDTAYFYDREHLLAVALTPQPIERWRVRHSIYDAPSFDADPEELDEIVAAAATADGVLLIYRKGRPEMRETASGALRWKRRDSPALAAQLLVLDDHAAVLSRERGGHVLRSIALCSGAAAGATTAFDAVFAADQSADRIVIVTMDAIVVHDADGRLLRRHELGLGPRAGRAAALMAWPQHPRAGTASGATVVADSPASQSGAAPTESWAAVVQDHDGVLTLWNESGFAGALALAAPRRGAERVAPLQITALTAGHWLVHAGGGLWLFERDQCRLQLEGQPVPPITPAFDPARREFSYLMRVDDGMVLMRWDLAEPGSGGVPLRLSPPPAESAAAGPEAPLHFFRTGSQLLVGSAKRLCSYDTSNEK